MSAYVKFDKNIYSPYPEYKTIMPPTVKQLKATFLHKSKQQMTTDGRREFYEEKFIPAYKRNTMKIEKVGHKVAFACDLRII